MYIMSEKLEWDEAKRTMTLRERGLDFADLTRFDWNEAIYSLDERQDYGEPRAIAFGFLDDRFVCVVYTNRGSNLRIISLRKANDRERKVYDRVKKTPTHR